MTETIIKKGYTLEVTSWENDGDYYNTHKITTQNKELAIVLAKMCKELFCSKNNGKNGIGNTNEGGEYKANLKILDYLEKNNIFDIIVDYLAEEDEDWKSDIDENDANDAKINVIMEINSRLMGNSDYYYSRVYSSHKLYYSPEDINIDLITI